MEEVKVEPDGHKSVGETWKKSKFHLLCESDLELEHV